MRAEELNEETLAQQFVNGAAKMFSHAASPATRGNWIRDCGPDGD